MAGIVDKGAFTGCVGYAHPTDAPDPAWTRAKACGLSDPQERHPAPESRPGGEGVALGPSRDVGACFSPTAPRAAAGALLRRSWWERRRPAASTPLRVRYAAPARPAGCGWRRRG